MKETRAAKAALDRQECLSPVVDEMDRQECLSPVVDEMDSVNGVW
jgi:hypothetical protein